MYTTYVSVYFKIKKMSCRLYWGLNNNSLMIEKKSQPLMYKLISEQIPERYGRTK